MSFNPLRLVEVTAAPLVTREFYQRPTADVARDVLGRLLVRSSEDGLLALRITEVEAYLGPDDPACHTAGGRRTERVRSMWGPAGRAYVYLIYGLHHCLNLVTARDGAGEAVLVRGGVAVYGLDGVRRRRSGVGDADLTNGPGKICQALDVDRGMDGADLCGVRDGLWLADDGVRIPDTEVNTTHRVGVGSAGEAALWPLRFVCSDR
jgi:DNA-3-methyladenine glycosylase